MRNIVFFFLAFLLVSKLQLNAQNVNYSVTITELYADADGNDGGLGINDQDPVWWIYLMDNGTTGTSLTSFQATGCISTTNTYGTWWSGNPSHSGPAIPFAWLNVSNTDATQLITQMEGWEDDCSPYCNYNPSPSLFSICVANGDDNHDGLGSSGNISFQNDAPCQNNQYEIFIGDYRARIQVYWDYVSVDAGTISGDQAVCTGGDPSILANVSSGAAGTSSWFTFQWQQDLGCTGSWVDIPGATNASYDPPLGILQNTCYRRKLVYGCGFFLSNEVTVTVDSPPTAPTSLTANPSALCGISPVTLTVNGGSIGSSAVWNWYAGDPNSGGTLLGTGSPFVTTLTNTTNVFVRAEGPCGITNTVNQIVIVETPSVAPTSLSATQSTICVGGSTDLTVSGGAPGTGAHYAWYDVDPTIGLPSPVFTSNGVNYTGITPLVTTTYYVRLEGCDTTAAVSTTITVNTLSSDPSGVSSSIGQVCSGTTVVLTVNGGTLGTGADWYWYAGGCGAGSPIGVGTSININPTITTSYYVRAQGTCNNSGCASTTIIVDQPSNDPVSVIVSDPSVCPGTTTTLSVIGGSLGAGANWQWYNGTCGGLNVGTGSTIAVNPTLTSTYYVRAEGSCNNTACVNETINVETLSTDPTGATSSANNICPNTSVDLMVNGGTLGDGANWEWYQGSCGGVYLGSGSVLSVSPSSTTTYYVRAEGNCNNTACESVTVTVRALPSPPTSIMASNGTVCPGGNVTLSTNGGTLIGADDWVWYEGGCGAGASIGNGNSISTNPTGTTTYFVRAEGVCGNSSCTDVTITTYALSNDPVSVIASDASICPGDNTTLSVIGGSLGASANWQWFSSACGGLNVGSGSTIAVNPSTTTTYFVRAEGLCNTTNCVSTSINIEALSTAPSGANSSVNNVCPNTSVDVSVLGGSLGDGATWEWYQGSCGGIYLGSGATLTVQPSTTTTYFVRAEGNCNTTSCESVTVIVQDLSTTPTSVVASSSSVCPGGSVTLTVNGGTLVTGDVWTWYESGCGAGTSIGSGTSINVNPTAATTYYVRAEGACGVTNCASASVALNDVSVAATGITASATAICVGNSVVLNVSGGTLGTGANWQWYQGACGGGPVGSGNSISVTPSATTTYFVRGEGTCGNSTCVDITISVGAGINDPTSAFSSSNNICPGDEVELTVIGQALPANYSYVWYTGACGAIPIGIGEVIPVSPTETTTYYVAAVGTCGSTSCADVTVTVLDGSIAADGIIASNNNFCLGESTTLTVDGGYLTNGAQWVWYQNSCGGTSVGTGTTITLSPLNSTSYYVRAEGGTCGNTACSDAFISVIETIVHTNPYDTLCGIGPEFTLNGGEPNGGSYSGTGVANNIFDPEVAGIGIHEITYTYTSPSGCVETVMTDIVIEETDLTAQVKIDQLSCSQGGTTLSIVANGGNGFLTYSWSNGTYESTIDFAQEGSYYCYIKDGEGCIAKSDVVEVTDEMECIEIPNTFTPNDDGINDTWNLDFSSYTDVKMVVFSKWGREVYSTGDNIIHWDGMSQSGAKLPNGVYYYVLELNGGEINQSGFVTLLR
ncbi:MAG: gliding motility-associated C-terminal domain-containing protein [Flavobacteriales bacterium]|nr:gliding motility-associated C-terminal domain-containing protein [Flavobacteriales bacterium]MCB9196695.1 gliding motility-associated C-terminal domain-containing protein [Flavobacteriales bacterium]